jgi:hypothetical protein
MSEKDTTEQHSPHENTIIYAEDGNGWLLEGDAKAEFRQRKLESNTWGITRSQKGEGFCIMTFRMMLELQKRRQEEYRLANIANQKPMKYFHVHIGTSADSDKRDMLNLVVGLNGVNTLLMLNSRCVLSEAQIEILENARTENWVPLPDGGPDGKTFSKRGWKDRVNYSKEGSATEQEWRDYQLRNKTKFDAFVAEQSKEREDTALAM